MSNSTTSRQSFFLESKVYQSQAFPITLAPFILHQ
jgi:hypothetical protein